MIEIKEYLEQVVAGTLPVNHQIIYNLQDVFNLLPNLEGALKGGNSGLDGEGDGKRPFTVATNDQLLVMYLSSLIRAVIALHDLVSVLHVTSPSRLRCAHRLLSCFVQVLNKQTAAETTNEEEEAEEARQAAADKEKQEKKEKEGDGKSKEEKTRDYFTGEKKDSEDHKKKKDGDDRGH